MPSNAFEVDNAAGAAMHDLMADILIKKVNKGLLDVISIAKAGRKWDQQHGIDYLLLTRSGRVYSLQEKCLRSENVHHDTMTIEYMSDRIAGVEGDFFNCNVDFYFVGYGDPAQGFLSAYLLNYRAVKNRIKAEMLKPTTRKPINGHHPDRSSFYAYPIKYIPRSGQQNCFLYYQPPVQQDSAPVGGNTQAGTLRSF